MVNTLTISVSVSREFHDLAVQHKISWSEAMRVGLAVMFGDLGLMEYNTDLNLHRKMTMFRDELEKKSQELEALKQKAQILGMNIE